MKRIQLVDALKNIKNRWASFLSVVLIIALGTGGYFTTLSVDQSFQKTSDNFYEEGNFKDYEMISSGGIVDKDLQKIKEVEGVNDAEGVILFDGEANINNNNYKVTFISITERISKPVIVEGNFPTKANEVLINEDLAIISNVKVNDVITLKNGTNFEENPLKEEKHIVSGIMRHPEYIRYTHTLSIALPLDAINMKATNDSYLRAFIDGEDNIESKIQEIIPTLNKDTKLRMDETIDSRIEQKTQEVNEQLNQAKQEIDDKEKEANEKLKEAEKEIQQFESLFVEGQKQIEEGKTQLHNAHDKLIKGEQDLQQARKQLQEGKQTYNESQSIINEIENITGKKINIDEIIKYIKTADSYADKLKTDIETGNDQQTISLQTLVDYLHNDTVKEVLEVLRESDDIVEVIIDSDKAKSEAEIIKKQINDILNESDIAKIRFRDYFTYKGLDEVIDELQFLVDVLVDAYKDESIEKINEAKQALREFFDRKGSDVLEELLNEYYGISLEEFSELILNSSETLNEISISLDELLTEFEESDILTPENIKENLNELIDLADSYLDSIIEDNKEQIHIYEEQFLEFCDREDIQLTIQIIDDATGLDLKNYIDLIKMAHDFGMHVEDLKTLINLAGQAKTIINETEVFDSIDKSILVDSIKTINDKLKIIADLGSTLSKENIQSIIDTIISEDTFEYLNFYIKAKYGIDIKEIINNADTILEIQYHLLKFGIAQLKYNPKLQEVFDTILNTLNTVDNVADLIIFGVKNLDTDILVDNILELIRVTSQPSFDFAKTLINKYFDYSFTFKLSDFISIKGLNEISSILKELLNQANSFKGAPALIESAEKQIADGEKQIIDGWRAYYAGIEEIQNNEKLLSSSAEQIAEARKQLNDKKQEAIKLIEDARSQLRDAELSAKDEINKAKEELLNRNYNWIIQDKTTNQSHMDISGTIAGVKGASLAFGTLFLLVISLVCFSTIAMIVEEEKRSVGTTKAFGFYNREIFNKYLLFGVLAGIIGCILGLILSYIITYFVMNSIESTHMYLFGKYTIKTQPLPMLITSIFIIGLTILTTFIACTDLLKTPAALLMKGDTISSRNRKEKKKETKNKSKRSLYSRLILRNIVNEKERVLITVLIIAASCFIVGVGITLRDSFLGMMNKEKEEIMIYDFRIGYREDISEEELNEIEISLDKNNTSYLNAYYNGHLFDNNGQVNGIVFIVADRNKINDYIAIKDLKTKETIIPPLEGILIQNRLTESFGLEVGETIKLFDNNLDVYDIPINGVFTNYQGRYIIASNEAYEKIFNEKVKNNTYFVDLNGADYDDVYAQLNSISDKIVIERADSYMPRLQSSVKLYNTIVIILTIMAIIMSFMVITNLANIFISRKKKELIIMRINGFSIKQTINYLSKEAILTTIIGIVGAVIGGIIFATPINKLFEQPDTMLIRSFNIKAWIIAICLESIFSFIIHYIVFRKVKNLNFREVT